MKVSSALHSPLKSLLNPAPGSRWSESVTLNLCCRFITNSEPSPWEQVLSNQLREHRADVTGSGWKHTAQVGKPDLLSCLLIFFLGMSMWQNSRFSPDIFMWVFYPRFISSLSPILVHFLWILLSFHPASLQPSCLLMVCLFLTTWWVFLWLLPASLVRTCLWEHDFLTTEERTDSPDLITLWQTMRTSWPR